jgi:ribosomal-protein-alanine N-acetyltransferase
MQIAALRCRLRTMQSEDIPQIMDIERQSFPTMWPQSAYQKELKNKMARYFVAVEAEEGDAGDGAASAGRPAVRRLVQRFFGGLPGEGAQAERVLGFVGLWCMMGEGHIVTIAVRDEWRRQGIGELLLVAALDAAVEAVQDVVTLEYRVSNAAARALYEKYGFAQVGVRARYYSDNHEDAVLMTTPPLRSSAFRRILDERKAALRARWGDAYPL